MGVVYEWIQNLCMRNTIPITTKPQSLTYLNYNAGKSKMLLFSNYNESYS